MVERKLSQTPVSRAKCGAGALTIIAAAALSLGLPAASAHAGPAEPPALKTYSIDAAGFSPYDAVAARLFKRDVLGNLTTDADSATVCMTAGLQLPNGAVMKKIVITFSSGSPSNIFFHLRRRNLASFNIEEIVNKPILEDDDHVKRVTVNVPAGKAVVDNALYGYPLTVCFGKGDSVVGFQVRYE